MAWFWLHPIRSQRKFKSKKLDFSLGAEDSETRLLDMWELQEKEILETLIALLAQCDELLNDLERYSPKYDELIRTTRAAYGNALAVYVAD